MENNSNLFADRNNLVILIVLFVIFVFILNISSLKPQNNNLTSISTQSNNLDLSNDKSNNTNKLNTSNISENQSKSINPSINNNSKTTTSNNKCIQPKEAVNFLGKIVCIEYFVAYPYKSSNGNIFLNEKLNYKNGFTVWIPADSVKNFSSDPFVKYGYKNIQATGEIKIYKGQLEIIANTEDQILLLN